MKPNKILVHIGSIAFIGIILFLLFIVFNFVGSTFYNENLDQNWLSQFDKDEIPTPTPTPSPSPNPVPPNPNPTPKPPSVDKETITWSWYFKGNSRTISCTVPKNYLEKCRNNRERTNNYTGLYEHDLPYLHDFIAKFKKIMQDSNLDYMESIGLVCSAIQNINYTLILSSKGIESPKGSGRRVKCPCELSFGSYVNNCTSQIEGGCCNNVDPFGVYSPYEFFNKKTGDCDTRALLAFTVLKKLGFDVAVMVSEKEHHSVLGIYLPNASSRGYSYGIDKSSGKKYLLWELTSKNWEFGKDRVDGNDWIVEN